MVYIGNGPHETQSVPLTLLSNASTDIYVNTLTQFSNALPQTLAPGRHIYELFIQLKSVRISKKLLFGRADGKYPLMFIYLRELEHQIVGNITTPLLAMIDMTKVVADPNKVSGRYAMIDFENAPVLKLAACQINHLSISICNEDGYAYPLAQGPPTTIQLEISSMNVSREFTITCLSHPKGNTLFPNNTASNFHSQLPRTMDLSNWEVALSQVSVPKHIDDETVLAIYIALTADQQGSFNSVADENKLVFTEKVAEVKTFIEFIAKLNALIQTKDNLNAIMSISKANVSGSRWKIDNSSEDHFIQIGLNDATATVLGFPTDKTFLTAPKAGKNDEDEAVVPSSIDITGPNFSASNQTEPLAGIESDLTMVYCDKVKDSIVGNTTVPLIGLVPTLWNKSTSKKGKKSPTYVVYEPLNLMYYDVKEGNMTDIGFTFRRGDGEMISIKEENKDHFKNSGGTIITLRFRPKTMNALVPQEHEARNYERKWRSGTYKHGPGGFY